MIYLDTGCFVKLYYPEPDSSSVIALVQGKPICYTPLHELEFTNALLHCALAKVMGVTEFVTSDIRQKQLVGAMGMTLLPP